MSHKNLPMFVRLMDLSKLKILRFYRYTTVVQDRIVCIEREDKETLKDLFDAFRIKAENTIFRIGDMNPEETRSGERLWDNKIAFECELPSGAIIFIGFYDGAKHIGLSVTSDSWITPINAIPC